MMRALVKYGRNRGEVEMRDIPVPALRAGDVLIEVRAAGICGSDIGFFDGTHEEVCRPPVVLGHEFAGVVADVGPGQEQWRPGDRIVSDNTGFVCGACHACAVGDYLLCPTRLGLGYGMDGGFAPYVRVDGSLLARVPHSVFRVPAGMPFAHAAILDPVANAYRAVVQEGRLLPGDRVAVYGVGAIGLFAIQLARIAGASDIFAVGLAADEARFRVAEKSGATLSIRSDREDAAAVIRDATGGEGVALAVDAAGPTPALESALRAVRTAGRVVRIGFDPVPPRFSLDVLPGKGIDLKGHYGYDWASCVNCLRLAEKGILDMGAVISHTMSLERWSEGFALTRSREAIKVILTPEPTRAGGG
jgi:threonine dehydrogenase-like Zn-dependent dehydrogenase